MNSFLSILTGIISGAIITILTPEILSFRTRWRKKNEADQINRILSSAQVDPDGWDIMTELKKIDDNHRIAINNLLESVDKLKADRRNESYEFNLASAKAFAAVREWPKAAEQFEAATKINTTSWDLYFSQGIAFANSRLGAESELKALQSYSSAIAFLPENIDPDIKARLYIYKGALLKRLNRLDEAESDIKLGLEYACEEYERNDGLYNLACIYAMRNRKEDFERAAGELRYYNKGHYDYLLKRLKHYAPDFALKL